MAKVILVFVALCAVVVAKFCVSEMNCKECTELNCVYWHSKSASFCGDASGMGFPNKVRSAQRCPKSEYILMASKTVKVEHAVHEQGTEPINGNLTAIFNAVSINGDQVMKNDTNPSLMKSINATTMPAALDNEKAIQIELKYTRCKEFSLQRRLRRLKRGKPLSEDQYELAIVNCMRV